MQEKLNILLVEDNLTISNSYKDIFECEGNNVFCAFDADEAVRLLNENPSFGFDLLFTDIDLVGDSSKGADKSGIALACYTHRILPTVPIIGHSAYFDNDDISPEEQRCFDEWFPKGIKIADREQMFDKALKLAKESRKARRDTKKITPIFSDSLNIPNTKEEFLDLGYEKDIIEPNSTNNFIHPISVWRRDSEEDGCELEVVGCSALLAWGENKEDAYEHLYSFIDSNKDLASMLDSQLKGSSLQLAKFIRKIVK
jgi:CheY-like chemotaxis protein